MPIPSTGLFRVYFSLVQIVSGPFEINSGLPNPKATTDAATIGAYFATRTSTPASAPQGWEGVDTGGGLYAPAVGAYELQCFPQTTVVFDQLGTPTPIDFISASFPIGVRFNQISLKIDGALEWKGHRRIVNLVEFINRGSIITSTVPTGNVSALSSAQIIGSLSFLGANQLFGYVSGYRFTEAVDGTLGLVIANLRVDLFYLQGVYNTAWINPTLTTANANPGEIITITAPSGLDTFESFKAYWKSNPTATEYSGAIELPIITLSPTIVKLMLPPNMGLPYGDRRMSIFGVPDPATLIDGEILLAQVNATPLLTNGTGIYVLSDNKRNDTYYDRSVSPVSTIEMKIP